MRRKFITALSVCVLCTACATPYQQRGYTGGFSEVRYAENIFKVSFDGNAYTGARTVEDYVMLRSAEIAIRNGFRYFQIAGAANESQSSSVQMPATATTTVVGNQATTNVYGGGLLTFNKPAISQVIICHKEKPEGLAFEAAFVARSLGAKYGRRPVADRAEPSVPASNTPGSSTNDCSVRVISAGGKPIPESEQCR